MSRKRRRDAAGLRATIEQRAGRRCVYCQSPQTACGYRFHLEHIIPLSEDGHDDEPNRALACAACNLAKSDRMRGIDPQTGRSVVLFNPRTDIWTEHFDWDCDLALVVGQTPVGRATVAALSLNDDLRLPSRHLWFSVGLLPP